MQFLQLAVQLPLAVQFLFDHFYLFFENFIFLLGHISLQPCVRVVLLLGSVANRVYWSHFLHLILHHFLQNRRLLLLRVFCYLLCLSCIFRTLLERLKRQSTKLLLLLSKVFDQILKFCNFPLIFLTLAEVPTPLFALLCQVECERGYLFLELFNLLKMILFYMIHTLAGSVKRDIFSGVVERVALIIALNGVHLKLRQKLVVLVQDG